MAELTQVFNEANAKLQHLQGLIQRRQYDQTAADVQECEILLQKMLVLDPNSPKTKQIQSTLDAKKTTISKSGAMQTKSSAPAVTSPAQTPVHHATAASPAPAHQKPASASAVTAIEKDVKWLRDALKKNMQANIQKYWTQLNQSLEKNKAELMQDAYGQSCYESTCNLLKAVYTEQLAKERHDRAKQLLGGLSNQLRLIELYLSRHDDVTAKRYLSSLRDAADQLLADARFNEFEEVVVFGKEYSALVSRLEGKLSEQQMQNAIAPFRSRLTTLAQRLEEELQKENVGLSQCYAAELKAALPQFQSQFSTQAAAGPVIEQCNAVLHKFETTIPPLLARLNAEQLNSVAEHQLQELQSAMDRSKFEAAAAIGPTVKAAAEKLKALPSPVPAAVTATLNEITKCLAALDEELHAMAAAKKAAEEKAAKDREAEQKRLAEESAKSVAEADSLAKQHLAAFPTGSVSVEGNVWKWQWAGDVGHFECTQHPELRGSAMADGLHGGLLVAFHHPVQLLCVFKKGTFTGHFRALSVMRPQLWSAAYSSGPIRCDKFDTAKAQITGAMPPLVVAAICSLPFSKPEIQKLRDDEIMHMKKRVWKEKEITRIQEAAKRVGHTYYYTDTKTTGGMNTVNAVHVSSLRVHHLPEPANEQAASMHVAYDVEHCNPFSISV